MMKQNIYSVKQINSYIKNMFAQDYLLKKVQVKGEVSNCKYHSSGHIYFTLKDETAALRCIMFVSNRKNGLKFKMQEGDGVVVTGSLQVYERDGTYQLYAAKIVSDGGGNLYQRFEELKKELEEMGMFAPEYKQAIPKYVSKVGVVTSPTGAAIQDIRNITARRNPYVQVILYPALVQGESAAASIIKGIRTLDAFGVDVMIVGRGGGSIEDLWAFNKEEVARAVFECETPVISAVGHETDTTIIDYVADLRAPTPSAAAELAVYDLAALQTELAAKKQKLNRCMEGKLQLLKERFLQYQTKFRLFSPVQQINMKRKRAGDLQEDLERAMRERIQEKRHRLQLLANGLENASPVKKISQGYGWVEKNALPVKDVSQLKQGDRLSIYLKTGRIGAEVTDVEIAVSGNSGRAYRV